MAKKVYILVETYDDETDFRERHYLDMDEFKAFLLRYWPELKEIFKWKPPPPSAYDLSSKRK